MTSEFSSFNQRLFLFLLFALATAVYFLGVFKIDLMDFDATEYACVSREVYQTGEYLQVKSHGMNYLDKPPLLFWLSAFSFKLFGVSQIAYRIPSFLFILLGVFSTYKLARQLYNQSTGIVAGIILYTCQAYFLICHDVRTDCLLTNSTIFSIWQLYMYVNFRKTKYFIMGFAGVSMAMLAKGPIGIIVPAFAIGSFLLARKEYKKILDIKWLLGLVIVSVCLLPMLVGLYRQFNVAGLKFYFWTQSFGRITGESKWKNDTGIFFFVHTFLWSFMPWSLLALAALGKKLAELFKKKLNSEREQLTTGGFVLTFVALSLSAYKLPHYIFIVFPFAAIFTADFITTSFLASVQNKRSNFLLRFQVFISCLVFIASALILTVVFPTYSAGIWFPFGALILLTLYFAFSPGFKKYRIITVSSLAMITGNFILNSQFYPSLLQYQSGSVVGKYYAQLPDPKFKIYKSLIWDHSIDFYSGTNAPILKDLGEVSTQLDNEKEIWMYTNEPGLSAVQRGGYKIEFIKPFDSFRVTGISLSFLNPTTRKKTLKQNYLIRMRKS